MALRVQLGESPKINASLRKVDFALVNLEQLNNVDETGLEDGFSLVYDASTQSWRTQLIQGGLDANATIDGGGY